MPIHETFTRAASLGLAMELLTLEVEHAGAIGVASRQSKSRATRLARAISSLGVQRFSEWWIPHRLAVNLQLRLWVESVLFSMNKPWSDLVSGFKPLRQPLGQWQTSQLKNKSKRQF